MGTSFPSTREQIFLAIYFSSFPGRILPVYHMAQKLQVVTTPIGLDQKEQERYVIYLMREDRRDDILRAITIFRV